MNMLSNLLVAGVISGAIYAVFGACLAVWFRVSNVLNLAVGDFAMIGAIGAAELSQVSHLPVLLAIFIPLVIAGVLAWTFDWAVLHFALDRGRENIGMVAVFFYTFALSFLIEGVTKILFGTDVYAAPPLWAGPALNAGGVHFQRAGILVIGLAVVSGFAMVGYLRFTMAGKAAIACGESTIGSRVVGINSQRVRRRIFIMTAVLAALFGVIESPITGFAYNTGPTISLVGVVVAGFAGFRRPGKAIVVGIGIGLIESLLGGYVSTQYNDVILYGLIAGVLIFSPEVLGLGALV